MNPFSMLSRVLWLPLLFLLSFSGIGLSQSVSAPIPDSLFTAGTTLTNGAGQSWAYLAFTPENAQVLRSRSLSIHLKNGLPQDAGNFEQQAIVEPVLDVSALSVFLARSEKLGASLAELDAVLYDIYRTRGLDGNNLPKILPTPPKPPLAEMMSSLLNRATGDADTMQALRMLGQGHPAMKMALGEAWAGALTAALGQPVTVEVREHTATGPQGVVGRVILTVGQPIVLPPPGSPVWVHDLSPKGDLNIKLRWGQDVALRRQAPLSGGFNVWRVSQEFAQSGGWDVAAPSLEQLQSWVTQGQAVRISAKPVLATKLFSPADASNIVVDPSTYFVADDNNRYHKNAAGLDVDEPFAEGSTWVYFVTSRDILGRDGPPSLPGSGIACRTLPPPVPNGLRVENHWRPTTDDQGVQGFQVFWKANTNDMKDRTDFYEVYRGTDLRSLQSEAGKAALNPVSLAPITHDADGVVMAYLDESPDVLTTDFGESFWFSVRAVHVTPCGAVKSDFSAPVTIARRQREGPPAPSGEVAMNCPRASTIYVSETDEAVPEVTVNDRLVRIRLIGQRIDLGIRSIDFSWKVGSATVDLGQHEFAAEGTEVVADFEVPRNQLPDQTVIVIAQARTHAGGVSNPKEVTVGHLPIAGNRRIVTFASRSLSDNDLIPGEAFSNELLEQPRSVDIAVQADGAGVALAGGDLEGRFILIQATPANAAVQNFVTVGHGVVTNEIVEFGVEPLPEGQSPPALIGRAFPVREFGEAECANLAFDPTTGKAAPLKVGIFLTPRTAEYRLFRRINDGPYTLVRQDKATYIASQALNKAYVTDNALPASSCTICYYSQVVDRDGNASALVRMEPCIEHRVPVLPQPRLAPPLEGGTAEDAKMQLRWSCPPDGISRFRITVEARGLGDTLTRLLSSANLSRTNPLDTRIVSYIDPTSPISALAVTKAAGSNTTNPNPGGMSVIQLGAKTSAWVKMKNTERFYTPALGNGYPKEPPFTQEINVVPGSSYRVYIEALGTKATGPKSAVYDFTWKIPTQEVEPAVAWPARPLPAVTTVGGIEARELSPVAWPTSLNGQSPVGVRLASLPSLGSEDYRTFGPQQDIVYAPISQSSGFGRQDPNAHVLAPIGDGRKQVLGVVLYRQQVANQLFPQVSGDTIQVSPLVRKIAWRVNNEFGPGAQLIDPYFAITITGPPVGVNSIQTDISLWLLDTQGVIEGARYHYYVVCFGADGEISQTIDAGFTGPA